jgi:hypothetical protein
MRVESTAITLRRREPWEAVDLGFAMMREWWRPVYAAWLATFVPAAALALLVFREDPWIAMLILWWLKPVFDRIVLHVLSRAVFGEVIGVGSLLRDWREYARPGLVAGQLWGRVDLARSFDLPVWQLERESWGAGRKRREVLQKRARYHAVWLTAMCALFEAVLFIGQSLLIELATPGMARNEWLFDQLFDTGTGASLGIDAAIAYFVAVTVIEPFYVAGGFALYLNRRTLLEGWDLELALRRCATRQAVVRAVPVLLLALAVAAALPSPAHAAETVEAKSARQEIAEVMKAPEFRTYRETTAWRFRWPEWMRFDWDRAENESGTGFGEVFQALAKLVEIALWIAAAALVVAACRYLVRHGPRFFEARVPRAAPPPALFGLEIAPESLPPDVAAAAARLLAEGRVREALSLLYRGALSALVHGQGVEVQPGDTERDCERRAARVLTAEAAAYFGELVTAWEAAAYAGRVPDAERARRLAASWPAHFTGAAA